MQLPMTKLLRLLHPDHAAEVRRAAALVLGELGVRDAEAADALCERLEDAEPSVRLEAIRAVGKLRVEPALPRLLERIREGGEEADAAAHAAAHLGPKGTRALQELMPKVAPGLRRYIAAALAGGGTASATAATAAVLLDKDPGVVEAAVRSLAEQIPTLAAAQRQAWTDHLLELAGDRKGGLPARRRRRWSACWPPWTTRGPAPPFGRRRVRRTGRKCGRPRSRPSASGRIPPRKIN